MPRAKPGQRFGGRAKGTPNKLTQSIKESFDSAFQQMGGTNFLFEWAMANPTDFMKIYGKMLPTNVNANMAITTHEDRLAALAELERAAEGKSE